MSGPGGETSPLARALRARPAFAGSRAALALRAGPVHEELDPEAFWRQVLLLSRALADQGLQPGDRLAWLGLNHPLQLAALFACARLGAIFMPLNFRLAVAELQQVLDDATPACLVHDEAHAAAAASLRVPRRLDPQALACALSAAAGDTAIAGDREITGDTPVLLVYTSGTTGRPRGALHTQAALLANARASEWAHGFTADDVVLSTLPLFHVGGLCIQTLPALLAGLPVILHPRFEPQAWLDEVATGAPTLSLLVPATIRALIERPDWAGVPLGRLRGIMTGSSTVPLHYLQAFHARGIPVGQVYGSTETGPVSVVLRLSEAIAREGETGWPHPGARLRLLDAQGREAGPGQTGEVCLQADNLMRGYWNPQGRAGDGLQHGWFHSGDLGCLAPDGCLRIVGRAKDMIISGGENIYPAEIENQLLALPGVLECAVVGVPDVRWGEVPVAAIVAAHGSGLDAAAVQAHLQDRIARFKLPRRVVFVEGLPKSALGKVQKAQLQGHLTSGPGSAG
ncbi:MAG: long-chain fatty acid--CoA ligase [Burkholderiales bacterium]|nr:MAG: long-chain fatty acid--CoA ligase [Burkholderiales bacterium]